MKIFLKYLFLILFIGYAPHTFYGQADTTQTKNKIERIDETKGAVGTNKLKAIPKLPAKTLPPMIDLNANKKINPESIKKNLDQNKKNKQHSMLLETLPEDRDIMGRKYWKGKDVTHQKLKSNMSLGTISSTTKTVKIECRDHAYIDGDRIRIYVNERAVSTNIGLKYNYYVLYVNLEPGYNRIDFQALNQGLSGPNTAELIVYDENGTVLSSNEWNLGTGQTATLGIIKK